MEQKFERLTECNSIVARIALQGQFSLLRTMTSSKRPIHQLT